MKISVDRLENYKTWFHFGSRKKVDSPHNNESELWEGRSRTKWNKWNSDGGKTWNGKWNGNGILWMFGVWLARIDNLFPSLPNERATRAFGDIGARDLREREFTQTVRKHRKQSPYMTTWTMVQWNSEMFTKLLLSIGLLRIPWVTVSMSKLGSHSRL